MTDLPFVTTETNGVDDDIVRELKDWQYIIDEVQGKATIIMLSGAVFRDAADEIERLQAEVTRLGSLLYRIKKLAQHEA